MTALGGKPQLKQNTRDKYCDVQRDEVGQTMHKAIPNTVRVIAHQTVQKDAAPVIDTGQAHGLHRFVGVKADKIATHEYGYEGTQPNGNHDAF